MITRLINELQHRRVFRSVAVYAVVAWIAVEAADVIFPALGVPGAALTWLIVIALAGFPIIAVLAWIYDVTSEGVVDYAMAALAAAGGDVQEALGHLQDAVSHGWRSFLFPNSDPAMASLLDLEAYQALIRQMEEM